MKITDIPKLSLEILKNNSPNYDQLSDSQIIDYFKCEYDIFALPKLPDEEIGLAILKDTIIKDELVIIATDFDADGIDGAAIAYKALKHKCNNYKVIHNKRVNGNGFREPFMKTIRAIHEDTPISLLISVDHGSNNIDSVDEMHAMGIKNVIITDHHAITDKGTTNADAFINPQRGCPELEWMCGAHVVLKLLSGLYIEDTKEYVFDNLYRPCLPHAALATVCDVVNLDTKYNRDCIRAGVMFMNADNFLWKKLVDKLGLSCKVCYKDLGFKLGPFVNTGNRTSTEELFYSILVETDSDKLDILIDQGCSLNISRKKVRQRAMVDIAKNITVKPGAKSLCYIVDVPMAINGVIASSLGGVYNIPVICFSLIKETGILSGSARANVKGVSIVDAFNYIKKKDSSVILAGGGHPGAGGCTISFDKFESFKELFEEAVSTMQVDTKDDKLIINFNTKYLNYGIVEEIDYCGPYGAKWQQPLLKGAFKVKKVYVYSSIIMLDVIAANGMLFKCTYFNDNVSDFNIVSGDVIIVTFEPQYYKRGKLVSLSLLIDEFCEVK